MEREKNKSYAIFIASSMFIKTFLSLCERTGSREVCVTQLQLSLSFSSRNYAAFNQTAQKQTVKRIKSEMEIHSPFTMHSLQTGEVLDFSSRILCRQLVSSCSIFPSIILIFLLGVEQFIKIRCNFNDPCRENGSLHQQKIV